jgi:hypothetical protein
LLLLLLLLLLFLLLFLLLLLGLLCLQLWSLLCMADDSNSEYVWLLPTT